MEDVVEARGRIGTHLATVFDADGKAIKFDIREDEEQNVKLQETVELLVAAGYFRARIKGLSAFDKVVGGMVWCISLCYIDVDVDLLYQENSTIGQKIQLTEKIVKVLPKMKCPHMIEPHQIQGLDFIHIYPVVQWLVKKAIEAKEASGDAVQAYATFQFDSRHEIPDDIERKAVINSAIGAQKSVKESGTPKRIYRKTKDLQLDDEAAQVHCTLLEYGVHGVASRIEKSHDKKSENGSSKKEDLSSELLSGMSEVSGPEIKLSAAAVASLLDSEEIQKMATDYARKETERIVQGSSVNCETGDSLAELQAERDELQQKLEELKAEEATFEAELRQMKERQSQMKEEKQELMEETERLEELEASVDKETVQKLKELMVAHDEVKQREQDYKDRCTTEMADIEADIQRLRNQNSSAPGSEAGKEEIREEYEAEREKFQESRLILADLNKQIASIQRKIDEVPSRAELNQYQRRFLELYNQVASKHRETKQFYTLYNTLTDVKTYMEKEISLLDSVYSQYNVAMSGESFKQDFLRQLGTIVEGIKQNQIRVEKRHTEEKMKRDQLRETYQEMLDKQRLYYKTVKDFQEECRKNETLSARIKEIDSGPDTE